MTTTTPLTLDQMQETLRKVLPTGAQGSIAFDTGSNQFKANVHSTGSGVFTFAIPPGQVYLTEDEFIEELKTHLAPLQAPLRDKDEDQKQAHAKTKTAHSQHAAKHDTESVRRAS